MSTASVTPNNRINAPGEKNVPVVLPDSRLQERLNALVQDAESRANVREILFRNGVGLGDAVVCAPAIAAVRTAFPNARVSVMLAPGSRSLIPLGYPGYRFPRYAHFESRSAFAGYDLVIDAEPINYAERPFLRRLRPDVPAVYLIQFDNREAFWVPIPERLQSGLARIQVPCDPLAPWMTVPNSAKKWVTRWLKAHKRRENQPLIIMAPGSGWPYKRWPAARFSALADALLERYNPTLVLVNGSKDVALATEVLDGMSHAGRVLFANDWSLSNVAALLQETTLLIGNDSGMAHVAASLHRPVVVIFGPTNHFAWAPSTDRAIVRGRVVCCFAPFSCEQPCLNNITMPEVLGAVEVLLTSAIGRDQFPVLDPIQLADTLAFDPTPTGGMWVQNYKWGLPLQVEHGGAYILDVLTTVERDRSAKCLAESHPDACPHLLAQLLRHGIVTPCPLPA